MKKSLYTRIIMIILAMMLTMNFFHFYMISKRVKTEIEGRINEEAALILSSLNWSIGPLLDAGAADSVQRVVENIGSYPMIAEVSVVEAGGGMLYSSGHPGGGEHSPPNLDMIFKDHQLQYRGRDKQTDSLIMAIPVRGEEFFSDRGSDVQAALLLTMKDDYEKNMASKLRQDYLLSALMINVLIVLLLMGVLYRELAVPLSKFRNVVDAVSDRKYSERIEINTKGEFRDLAGAFNQMTSAVIQHTEELKDAKEAAEQAASARVEFLANMSHEIRTPLNSIIGFTDLLEETETDKDKHEKLLTIQNSGRHLLTIINDILDISKSELSGVKLNNSTFNMVGLIKEIREAFEVTITSKGIDFEVFVDDSVPQYFYGDAHRIRQILANLLSNAAKFTSEGSIQVYVTYKAAILFIDVMDTGIGIEADEQEKIFDPFIQSDMSLTRKFGGTGLGLAICKRIAQAMEGSMSVKSEVGKGSQFSVRLKMDAVDGPAFDYEEMVRAWLEYDETVSDLVISVIQSLHERFENMMKAVDNSDAEELEGVVHSLKGTSGNFHMDEIYKITLEMDRDLKARWSIDSKTIAFLDQLKRIIEGIPEEYYTMEIIEEPLNSKTTGLLNVLLAEDVVENRELIHHILLGQSVKLDFAENGLEVLEKIEKADYDVLLLDIQMPIMGGEEVLEKLRERTDVKSLYVIALTAHARQEDMERYIAMGADWYMSKPIDKRILRAKIVELLKMKG